MTRQTVLSMAVVGALLACWPHPAQAQSRRRNWDFSLDGGRGAERCSDLKARTSRELAQTTETFTLSKSAASPLEISAPDHAVLYVRGWDGPDYAVEACKFAVAGTRSAADTALRSVAVNRNGSQFTASGPSDRDSGWRVVFFVHAPRDASVKLDSGNAPVEATNVTGTLTIRATNGPLALERCAGTIDAETVNGPISMTGGSGDVRLLASNGPISLHLDDAAWSGSQLQVRTDNGPLSVTLPGGFRSGVRVETSGHAPIHCAADACPAARTEGNRFFPRSMQLNGATDTVRLSTQNGPVSIRNTAKQTPVL